LKEANMLGPYLTDLKQKPEAQASDYYLTISTNPAKRVRSTASSRHISHSALRPTKTPPVIAAVLENIHALSQLKGSQTSFCYLAYC
jgi:hypothetical protein